MTSAEWTSCFACHEPLCSRAFLFIVLQGAQHPQIPRFLQYFRGIWPMPLSLLNHPALALFAQHTRIPTSARSIGFCAIWVCISSSSSSRNGELQLRVGRSGDRGRTRNLCLLPRLDPAGFMKVKFINSLRKRTLRPVRLVLEDSSKRSFMLLVVVVSLQFNLIQSAGSMNGSNSNSN